MKKPNPTNVLVLLLPLLCLLGGAGTAAVQIRNIQTLQAQTRQAEQNIAIVQASLQDLQNSPAPARFPTEPLTPREQVDYLNTLRAYADATKVRLVSWTNATPLAPTNSSGAPDPSASVLPQGITAVGSAVVISGRYSNVREFLYYLLRSPRLYTMGDLRWTRSEHWPDTSASFTLTRYVTISSSTQTGQLGTTMPTTDLGSSPTSGSSAPTLPPPPGRGYVRQPGAPLMGVTR